MFYIARLSLEEIIANNFTYVIGAFVVCVVLFLVMMIYYKVRISKLEQYVDYLKDQSKVVNNEVSNIAKKIEEDLYTREPKSSKFEDEQEQKAIISYQDLLRKSKTTADYPYQQKPEVPKEQPVYVAPQPVREQPAQTQYTPRVVPTEVMEQIRLVPEEIRVRAIKEKPVVRETGQFLNSLVDLRSNMK